MAAINIHAIGSGDAVLRRVQRRIIAAGAEIMIVSRIMPVGREVRSHIRGVRGDRHRSAEVHLLPSGGRFARECSRSQQRAGIAPQVSGVCANVGCGFVKANARNQAIIISGEAHAVFARPSITRVNQPRSS